MGNTYNNTQGLDVKNVDLAIEQFLVAPYGTAFELGRIDVDSPPSGWTHLGAVWQETPASLEVDISENTLTVGIPETDFCSDVIGIAGKVSFALIGNTNTQVVYALGNLTTPQNIRGVAAAAATRVVKASPAPSVTAITLTANAPADWVADDILYIASTRAGLLGSENYGIIATCVDDAVTVDAPGFPTLPVAGDIVEKRPIEVVDGTPTRTAVSIVAAAAPAAWTAGVYLVTCAAADGIAGLLTSTNIAKLESVDGDDLVMEGTGFPTAPTATDLIAQVRGNRLPIGTVLVQEYAMIGVADGTRGRQLQHYFPRVQRMGSFKEFTDPKKRRNVDLSFRLMGGSSSEVSLVGSVAQRIIGQRCFYYEV